MPTINTHSSPRSAPSTPSRSRAGSQERSHSPGLGDGGSPVRPGAIPPAVPPNITLIRPSHDDACASRDASRRLFDGYDPNAELPENTVRQGTEHLGRTVVTVRNYLNRARGDANTVLDRLYAKFSHASASDADIRDPLAELHRLFANENNRIAVSDQATLILEEARGHLADAEDPDLVHDEHCASAQAALQMLGKCMTAGFDAIALHMQEAEETHETMCLDIAPLEADLFKSQGELVLRCLDYVLWKSFAPVADPAAVPDTTHANAPPNEAFNFDGFVQLCYSQNLLGAAVSYESMAVFVGDIADQGTKNVANAVAMQMSEANAAFNFETFLRMVFDSVAEVDKRKTQEALEAAMRRTAEERRLTAENVGAVGRSRVDSSDVSSTGRRRPRLDSSEDPDLPPNGGSRRRLNSADAIGSPSVAEI